MASTDLPPRFFKVFIPQFSSDSMMIPLSYYDELPRNLPKTAILQGTGGCIWKVAMKQKQDEIHFEQGWTNFVKDNSLIDGDFLTFVYNGDCVFEVSIYGLDGEKDSTRAVAAEVKDDKEDSFISISSEDNEVANPVTSTMSKGKARVEVEEDSDDTAKGKNKNKGKKKVEVAVESSDEESEDSDEGDYYIEAFGSLDVTTEKKGSCSLKAGTKQKRDTVKPKIKNPEAYLDNPDNLYLETGVKNRNYELLVHAQLVKDYDLKFAEKIVYMDSYKKLKAKAVQWSDQRVCVKRWEVICERNKVERKDRILCEFLRKGKLVYAVKVHIVRAKFL